MDSLLTQTLKTPWKAYCISLPRCIERRNTFSKWAEEIGLSFTFWDAFDKKNLLPDLFESKKVLVADQYSKGATACRISHELLWDHILKNDSQCKYFFILEDDAGFRSKTVNDLKQFVQNILSLRKPWSILQLGFGTMTGSDLHLLSSRNPPNIFQVDFCDQTHAILYTRDAIQGMRTLSKMDKYKTRPSDGLLLAFAQRKMGIVFAPRSSIIEQVDTISYISETIPTL
jgi:GR25 family glycosyltransferase involved in LPS biosynthesis